MLDGTPNSDPVDGGVEEIPRPEPHPCVADAYVPFPVAGLPEPLRGFVVLSAESLHCAPVFIVLPLLASLASAIGNSRRVEIKPDWREPAILWTLVAGKSGTGKTPGLEKAVRFALKQDLKAQSEAEARSAQHERVKQEYEREYSRWRRSSKNADPPPAKPNPPSEARHVVSDVTIEALAARLAESPRGLLLSRDEMSGWFGSFGLYKSGGASADEAQWLELYCGGPLRVDRKGKDGSVFVPRASVSITGGIQPRTLRKCLTDDRIASGLAARFMFAMPPDASQMWSDASVDSDTSDALEAVFRALYALTGRNEPEEHGLPPIDIPLSDAARTKFITFHDRLRREQPDLDDSLRAAWSKHISMAARLALIIHCIQDVVSPSWPPAPFINEAVMEAALTITEWSMGETRRVYAQMRESDQDKARRELVELIERRGGRLTVRDAMQARPGQFPSANAARAAFQDLEAAGLGRLERTPSGPKGGRPSDVITLGTDIDKTDKTSPGGGSVGFVDRHEGVS